ncbi:NAD(P)/FAD-dependent oxidoreductase [Actinoplanes sp. LDG1-06]|uniref:NAD(P)/FAD-dependent oxidoreductase n=1 Tax=Paractinoplanes ovalisporus TaxID=2810368 RepID=A0ABS2A938_9ACTN|nr:FAD/NAD(P)-binding oxidoreductase [Actinoplanes ovalisporus]MBM2616332.1 NAD(P)/FAD-dependent oxidoreductase [Actinoplanes ovalisporus]
MRRLVVLGAGTAGTMVVDKLRRRLARADWLITVVEPRDQHYYQPGFLFLPFGEYTPDQLTRPVAPLISPGVELVHAEVDRVVTTDDQVVLADGRRVDYDYLVIATGVCPRPEQTPGLLDGGHWRRTIFDFYTYEGALALAEALDRFDGGRLVVHITEMPIKCPVAPLEFAFLADEFLRGRGIRDRTELVYATPLPGAFTKPVAAARLGSMLDERKIAIEPDFLVERIEDRSLVSYDERRIPFDLLVTVPLNMGADFVARSGLGDELNLVPVDRHTFLAKGHDNIFAIGDANDIPTSKAGSVAHFSVDVFARNFTDLAAGKPMTGRFDGHANCFVESGRGRGLLIDFNYDTEPLPGTYPVPGVGPFRLLGESPVNHWGKRAFRWMYWNLLLPGRPLPLPAHMSMAGKHQPSTKE